jgi:glucose-6-phosphate isomerase
MSLFDQYSACKRLSLLKDELPNLTDKNVLNDSRIEKYVIKTDSLKYLYSTQRVDDKTLDALFDLAKESEAVKKMHDMQSGQVINKIENYPSENRAVLHTAIRDIFGKSSITTKAAGEARDFAISEIEKLKMFLERLEKEKKFTNLIQIGIGGSDLGPKAVYLALKNYQKSKREVFFISNVDPDNAASVLKKLDLKKTLVVCVSKSGTTLETLTNEEFVKEEFKKQGLNIKDHFIAVTAKDSPMDNREKYREVFYLKDYVGGRFSTSSMVGGVVLGFALGVDVFLDFLKGANSMDKIALEKDVNKNLPLFSALIGIWNRNFLKIPTLCVVPYSYPLDMFVKHLQQCDMESNGKSIDKKGNVIGFKTSPIIWGGSGTDVQHSFFQLAHQGTDVVNVEFIGFKRSQQQKDYICKNSSSQEKLLANLFAQSLALAMGKKDDNPNKNFKGNRPSSILLFNILDPFTMGMILAYYEARVAFQGFIWDINSFDQEGVQLGKTLANGILENRAIKQAHSMYEHLK